MLLSGSCDVAACGVRFAPSGSERSFDSLRLLRMTGLVKRLTLHPGSELPRLAWLA